MEETVPDDPVVDTNLPIPPGAAIIVRVPARGELEAIADGMSVLLARVTELVERAESGATRDDVLELVAVERGLASTLRRLQRLTARSTT
jgi:hypothetical protein